MRSSSSLLNKAIKQLPIISSEDLKLSFDLYQPPTSVNTFFKPHDPIVYLHGFYGSKETNKLECKNLANLTHTQVYALDFRNHGDSQHALPFDYNTLTEDLVQFCHNQNLKKVNLVGFSLGAKVSLLTALKHPSLVNSAVIIENAPVANHSAIPLVQIAHDLLYQLIEREDKIPIYDTEWREKAHRILGEIVKNKALIQYLLKNLSNKFPKNHIIDYDEGYVHLKPPVRLFTKEIISSLFDWPIDELESGAKFDGPVKVIKGSFSNFINQAGINAYNEYFTNYSIDELKTSHLVLTERPQLCIQIISEFINHQRFSSN
ncbi:hypothetical protein WICMUC_002933 [Wickerhamomyces mucosus]|uniref:AB hydrolase-1 domain-containing protein n=1 Tax=Wickerhamomyces mucosus TaxID=1378264 RepID=A0A9P8PN54_9ASCO|nr:hypothetical protein WICMUC_002933 [Wickerhamomyces mucosus]